MDRESCKVKNLAQSASWYQFILHRNNHSASHTISLIPTSCFENTSSITKGPDVGAAAAAKSLQSCLTLCDPTDGSPPGSPVPGILQARTLEWVAISFSNAWKWKVKEKLLSPVRLLDPMDCSPPGSSVHGTFQARGLEWVRCRREGCNINSALLLGRWMWGD